ncbi:MAG: PAS domain-containing protein [Candidatus Tectomicrobia bacterium]|nr:PAS domain-containing protein [Candidatus Tectomicrobia bacterium]
MRVWKLWSQAGGQPGPPPAPAREGAPLSRLRDMRLDSRRLRFQVIGGTALLLAILVLFSIQLYSDARLDIEDQFNRQQLLIAEQAGGRIALFLIELAGNLRYSARFVRTVGHDHPGRMSAMTGLYERLGGSHKVSEVGYLRGPGRPGVPATNEYAESLLQCPAEQDACLQVVREMGGEPAYVLGGARVGEDDWLYAKVTLDDLDRSFVQPVQSGLKGRAWLVDNDGRVLLSPAVPGMVGLRIGDLAQTLGDRRLGGIARQIMLGAQGYGWHFYFRPGEKGWGHRYLTAYSPFLVGEEAWTLAVTAPSSEVVETVRRAFRKGFLLTGFGFIVVISAALLVLDRDRRRIRAEEKLLWSEQVFESKRRLQALFDGITDGICIVGRDFRIQMVNRAMARLLGKRIADLLDRPWGGEDSPVPPALADRAPAAAAFEDGRRGFAERTSALPDGKRMDIEIYTYPIFRAEGEAGQVILYLKDVTERRALQREVQQRDRLSIVGKMSAQVAHSIRNPLSAINLNAELLEDELGRFGEADTAEAWSLLRSIKAEVGILRQVTDDYLKFVRMPRSDRRPGDLNELLGEMLDFYAEEAATLGIEVRRELSPDLPEVALDEAQMSVALQNLVRNAFDAMPRGGSLTLRTRPAGGGAAIELSDTGCGIAPEDQPALFTPFFTTKANGTGLGLVLTQQIVAEHKGVIRFASQPGQGATFSIELPAAAPMEARVEA